tara:strand:- start:849 stop:1598 length:750 start_codon:yes stop_codon:yes gene_type:complete
MIKRTFIIVKVIILVVSLNNTLIGQGAYNFLNYWIGLESLETTNLTYENRNISIVIEEGGNREGYYIYNSSSNFLFNEDLDWAYHYFTFVKDRYDEIIFLRRFITPVGVLGYEELTYNLTEWSENYFVADHIAADGESVHQIRMSVNILSNGKNFPISYNLKQNYPNPFNPQTVIEFQNPFNSNGSIYIYDVNGKLIHKLYKGKFHVGENIFKWNGKNDFGEIVSSGNYIYTLNMDGFQLQSRTMTFIK